MRLCSECGKTLESGSTRCPFCGSTKVSLAAEVPADQGSQDASGTVSSGPKIVFDRGEAAPAAPSAPTPLAPGTGTLPEAENSWVEKLLNQMTRPKFWLMAGVGLAVLGGLAWWALTPRGPHVEEVQADPNAVDPVLAKEFSKIVDTSVLEKLEWGREIMKRRTPSRFPEELLMEVERDKAEIRFSNPEKTAAYYRFMMAYHYKETHQKLYAWTSVAFFFERRDGKWVLVGDQWPREWEVVLE